MNSIMKTHFPYIFTFLLGCFALQAQTITNFLPRNGKEGTPITITGTGFTGTVEVAFGSSGFVSATVNSATEITANVPSDASAGKVKVKVNGGAEVLSPADLDGNGTEGDETDGFRYVSITGFSPMEAGVGEKVTFRGTGFATIKSRLGWEGQFIVSFRSSDCKARASKISDGTAAEISVPSCAQSGDMSVTVRPNRDEFSLVTEDPNSVYKTYEFELSGFVRRARGELIVNSFAPAAAGVGQVVRITGTGFLISGRNKVTFGHPDAVGEVISSSANSGVQTLRVHVPTNAVSGKISVEVKSETAETPADFTFLMHTVEDFNPKTFYHGDELTITGTNFAGITQESNPGSPAVHANEVCFGSQCVNYTSQNSVGSKKPVVSVNSKGTRLTLNVPDDIRTGARTLKVKIGDREVEAGEYTAREIPPFTFTSFAPTEARIGQTVTLTGTGFRREGNLVFLDGVISELGSMRVYEVNEDLTEIKARIGPAIRGHEGDVTGITVGVRGESLTGFSVTPTPPLSITGIPSEPVLRGQEITITGTGFSLHAPDSEVFFSTGTTRFQNAHEVNAEGTELKVRVHFSASPIPITVRYLRSSDEIHNATSTERLNVRKEVPTVTSFSPASGRPGDTITITGSDFSPYAEYNQVSFAYDRIDREGKFVTTVWAKEDGTQLKAVVGQAPLPGIDSDDPLPDPVPTYPIGVKVAGGSTRDVGISSDDFTFEEEIENKPVVMSFSPTEGEVGTIVTITGTDFRDNPAENTVTFGGNVKATPSASTTTSITVKAPAGVRTGRISVTVDGETGTSEENFTVPGIEPVPPPRPSDILNVPGAEGVRVYPNPASREVRLTNLPAAAHTYRIYSLAGKAALTGAARDSATIDVSGLARGQYVLVLRTEDGSETLRTRLLLLK